MMLKKYLSISLLACLAILVFYGCSTQSLTNSEYQRDEDPWVFRSVLDQKPRMLTLALNKEMWVAYSTQYASIYKAWKGGVDLNGAVYTTQHGPQPTSLGKAYFENAQDEPWFLVKAGKESPARVKYLGHRMQNNQATLLYAIESEGGEDILIEETPEFFEDPEGNPILERNYVTKNVPNGSQIALKINADNLISGNDLNTTGEFKKAEQADKEINDIQVVSISGTLLLNNDDKTSLRLTFHPGAVIGDEEGEMAALSPEAIIEKSDCRSCHNEEVKTVGPAYLTVAEKYDNTLQNLEYLSNKILKGGSGVWGEAVMNAHPNLSYDEAETLTKYILALDKNEDINEFEATDPNRGVVVNIYQFFEPLESLPTPDEEQKPVMSEVTDRVLINTNLIQPITYGFMAEVKGFITIARSGKYIFRSRNSNGGSKLTIDGQTLLDFSDYHEGGWVVSPDAEVELGAGKYPFSFSYFRAKANQAELNDKWYGVVRWKAPGDERFRLIPRDLLTYNPDELIEDKDEVVANYTGPKVPGDLFPLKAVHPSFDLSQARPDDFQPKVAGMDFLPDGRLVVSTWDSTGAVYILKGVQGDDPEKIEVKKFAQGLAEPLGLKVVDGDIYVLQKQELTRLVDLDGDEVADEYLNVCNGWKVSSNFHEFAFGLEYKDGHFYGALATAILPGGASANPQIPDRGKIMKINKETGKHEFLAYGMRTPNGIGFGVDGELFNADNQGDWLPASKVVHVQNGAFYGSRSVDFEGTKELKMTPPMVWMPQDEIGNSPAQIGILKDGPYKDQMIVGEVTHGGLKRIYPEKVNGQYQGALFRFVQGLEAGVNRFAWGEDGALYIGGIGVSGNWGHYVDGEMGKFGLQKIKFNGKPTFEMLAVRAKSDGLEIEFTEALKPYQGINANDYLIKQWWYKPTESYGGPKMDEETLNIKSVNVSEDRKKVFLELEGMKAGHLLYVRLLNGLISEAGQGLWANECWYTMNQIPTDNPGFRREAIEPLADNTLSPEEKAAGWKLLFDGESTQGWRNYKSEEIGDAWRVEEGALVLRRDLSENAGDIISEEAYENYELNLEWKISPGGNSGIIYNVIESDEYDHVWQTGPEMQVLDNAAHPDAKIIKHRAGDLYDLIECDYMIVKSANEWNQVRLIINKGKVEHWLNGRKVVAYELWTDDWKKMVANSKFKDMPGFGTAKKGHIALQDHSDVVYYKNIKIKVLD